MFTSSQALPLLLEKPPKPWTLLSLWTPPIVTIESNIITIVLVALIENFFTWR